MLRVRVVLLILAFVMGGTLSAQAEYKPNDPHYYSPVRKPNEDWREALNRQVKKIHIETPRLQALVTDDSPADPDWDQPDPGIETLPVWPLGMAELEIAFKRARDEAIYPNPEIPIGFPRRASWLYPIDGCFAKATHVAKSLERQGFVRPGRVYALGHLRYKTPYAPSGYVYWSYHTASAYNMGGTAMVLDPAIEPHHVITMQEWLSLISKDPTKIKTRFCDTYAYMPGHKCISGNASQEAGADRDNRGYLNDEWINLRGRGFDPKRLLGTEPPWLN
jgi:hypothetical protein